MPLKAQQSDIKHLASDTGDGLRKSVTCNRGRKEAVVTSELKLIDMLT